MPSKISFKNLDKIKQSIPKSGAVLIEFPDCFLERIFIDKVEKDYKKVFGVDIDRDWIENELLSIGLFGSDGPYLCLLSEQLNPKVREKLKEVEIPDDVNIIFSTHQKFSDKELVKKFEHIVVEGPKFWEMSDYFDVLAKFFNVKLSFDIKDHLITSLEPTAYEYYNALMNLSSYRPEELNLNLVKTLIKQKHLDNFQLADLFNSKNLKRFYLSLLIIENDFDLYRGFFSFLQGHLVKIIDPSYMSGKAKLSKYDQGISLASKKWSKDEIADYLVKFGKYELMCKQKSEWFRDELRKEFLAI
ncbi:hypothetical protein M900_2152 [Bacteriovorax sp. Seq25_V]|nr:hypothetical protein M900_2152 [Bacteriovorax sp. Seq25_V]